MSNPNQIAAYRRKKLAQLWTLIGQYAATLERRAVLPDGIAEAELIAPFGAQALTDLTAAEERQFWRLCAETVYRRKALRQFGTLRFSELTEKQLRRLILDALREQTAAVSASPANAPTEKQRRAIWAMQQQLGWNSERSAKFCQRICKRDVPATRREASDLIQALKAMIAAQNN